MILKCASSNSCVPPPMGAVGVTLKDRARYHQVPVYQVPVYQEDQDQISGATYISDVVIPR